MNTPISNGLHVVTGAFGFSGKYIARRLLDAGCRVRTLTNSPRRKNPFGDAVEVHPFNFDDAAQLTESLARRESALQHLLGSLQSSALSSIRRPSTTRSSCSTPRKRPAWAASCM